MMESLRQFVTVRALVIGAILCFCIAVGEPVGVLLIHGSPMCPDFSTGGAVFLFFILTFAINSLLKLMNKRLSLSSHELITVYIMMIVACAIVSWGFVMNLLYLIGGVHYYATPSNNWQELIHPHLKPWLTPQNPEAIRTFFEGLPKGESIPWGAWIVPLISWFSFIIVVYFVMVCMAVIMRKQWVEKERLIFPLTQLPLEMANPGEGNIPPFFKNKVMWLGFAIPAIIHSLNALHSYFHIIPPIELEKYISIMSGSGGICIRTYFEVIGLTFLLTRDISLSLWLFAVIGIVETAVFNRIGFSIGPIQRYSNPGPQTVANQGLGAMIVFVLISLWFARAHIKEVFRKAFRGDKDIDDSEEALSYRTCVFGIIIGFIFLAVWLIFGGLKPLATIMFLFFAFIIFIGLTKIVAQAGLAYGRAPVAPCVATNYAVGGLALGPGGLVSLGLTFAWAADIRTIVMTSTTNALKLTDSTNIKGRRIFTAIIIAILVTLISTSCTVLLLSYKHGAINFGGWQPKGLPTATFQWVVNFIHHPVEIGKAQFGWMAIGATLMFLLTLARARFLWWPIHPIGLTLGLAGPFAWVWFSVFLGWLMKVIIMWYGGPKGFKTARPFFLGLIIGSLATAGFWLIIDFFTGIQGNRLLLG